MTTKAEKFIEDYKKQIEIKDQQIADCNKEIALLRSGETSIKYMSMSQAVSERQTLNSVRQAYIQFTKDLEDLL